jgi:hypothetical protein
MLQSVSGPGGSYSSADQSNRKATESFYDALLEMAEILKTAEVNAGERDAYETALNDVKSLIGGARPRKTSRLAKYAALGGIAFASLAAGYLISGDNADKPIEKSAHVSSVSPAYSPSPSQSATPTKSQTLIQMSTKTPTPTPSPTPTETPISQSVTPSLTPSATPSFTPTSSPTPTVSSSATYSPTPSPTPTHTPTSTPSQSPSATPTSSPSASFTPTPTPTATPTSSPTNTPTPTPTLSTTATIAQPKIIPHKIPQDVKKVIKPDYKVVEKYEAWMDQYKPSKKELKDLAPRIASGAKEYKFATTEIDIPVIGWDLEASQGKQDLEWLVSGLPSTNIRRDISDLGSNSMLRLRGKIPPGSYDVSVILNDGRNMIERSMRRDFTVVVEPPVSPPVKEPSPFIQQAAKSMAPQVYAVNEDGTVVNTATNEIIYAPLPPAPLPEVQIGAVVPAPVGRHLEVKGNTMINELGHVFEMQKDGYWKRIEPKKPRWKFW